jgi:mRNA interferase RelE/StbE
VRKRDPAVARRIAGFLRERVATVPDPRSLGLALRGDEPGQFWKCRAGDYRVIAEIRDQAIRIVVVRVGKSDTAPADRLWAGVSYGAAGCLRLSPR